MIPRAGLCERCSVYEVNADVRAKEPQVVASKYWHGRES